MSNKPPKPSSPPKLTIVPVFKPTGSFIILDGNSGSEMVLIDACVPRAFAKICQDLFAAYTP